MADRDPEQKQLIYFADPMCSWCWGFAPVIETLADTFSDRPPVQLIMGGLRAGNTKEMDQDDKAYVKGHWEHVQARTDQDFNFDFFAREGFVYDTEPACRAVVTARSFHANHGLRLLSRLHEAFYVEGQDTTDRDTLVALAGAEGLDLEAFGEKFDSQEASMVTQIDFEIAKKVGVTGFPTLLAGSDQDGYGLVTSGYRPLDEIEGEIADWLKA